VNAALRLGRFQISRKIINAIATPMRFDGGMARRGGEEVFLTVFLTACNAGGFSGLIGHQNQLGADL
jgi:hypothetical protein